MVCVVWEPIYYLSVHLGEMSLWSCHFPVVQFSCSPCLSTVSVHSCACLPSSGHSSAADKYQHELCICLTQEHSVLTSLKMVPLSFYSFILYLFLIYMKYFHHYQWPLSELLLRQYCYSATTSSCKINPNKLKGLWHWGENTGESGQWVRDPACHLEWIRSAVLVLQLWILGMDEQLSWLAEAACEIWSFKREVYNTSLAAKESDFSFTPILLQYALCMYIIKALASIGKVPCSKATL